MNKKIKFIILLFVTIFSGSLSAQVQFKAQARSSVGLGERFQLVYTINEDGEDFRLPSIEDFSVLMGPSTMSSSSTSFVNGKFTRRKEYSYTYILKANKKGSFVIKPAKITVNGKRYSSNSLKINVTEGRVDNSQSNPNRTQRRMPQQSGSFASDDLFIRNEINRSTAYINQPIVLTTKIYTRVNISNITDLKTPNLSNFISQNVKEEGNIQWSYETVNGKQYQVGVLSKYVLYPQRIGKQTISPTQVEFVVRQRVARHSNNIFDDFFGESYRNVRKKVKTKPITLKIRNFPSLPPSDFTGGVGALTMDVNVSKNKVKVNDGITVKVKVSGLGNLKLISQPEINFPSDFETYDPTIKNNFKNTISGMKGSKTFEFLVIPRHAGKFVIDPIKFSFFNLNSRSFKTISSKSFVIDVEKGDMEQNNIAGYNPSSVSREDVKFVGKDIRFIKTGKAKLKPLETFLFGSLLFYLAYLIPLFILIIAFVFNQKRIKENANISLMKNKNANKMATKRLKKSSSYLKTKDANAFYAEVMKALYDYLSYKLFLPVSELNKDKVNELLNNKNVDADLIKQLNELLDTCEFAQYSPGANAEENMNNVYKQALNLISKIDNQIKK